MSSDGVCGLPHQGGRGGEEKLLQTHVRCEVLYACINKYADISLKKYVYIYIEKSMRAYVFFILFYQLYRITLIIWNICMLLAGMMYLTLQCANEKQMMEWASSMYHAISIANGGAYILQYERDRMSAEMEVIMMAVK